MRISEGQIRHAKQIDLLTYLQQHDPYELIRVTPREYCTRSHDSLRISNGLWHWCSRGIGGRSALDYLIKVKNMTFVEAVNHLVGGFSYAHSDSTIRASSPAREMENKKTLVLPPRHYNNDRVIAYLRSRGIDDRLITYCIRQRMLYESANHHNAVFVGIDDHGMPRYGTLRGTTGADFKGDVSGSDKQFSFNIPARQPSCALYVFESAIDLLSHVSLHMLNGDARPSHRVSLSSATHKKEDEETLPLALGHYLLVHQEITSIHLCLDNDEAGITASRVIQSRLQNRYEVHESFPPQGKDFNDYLCMLCLLHNKPARPITERQR